MHKTAMPRLPGTRVVCRARTSGNRTATHGPPEQPGGWRLHTSPVTRRHHATSRNVTESSEGLPATPSLPTTTPSLWGVGQTRQRVHGPSHRPPHGRRKLLQIPPWLGPGVGSTRLQLPTLLLLTQPMPLAGTSQGRQRSSPGRGPQHPHGHHGPSHSPCSSRALSANPLTSSRLCRCRFFLLLLTPMCHSPLPAQPPPTRLCQTNPPTPGCPVPDGSSRTRPTVCPLVHL